MMEQNRFIILTGDIRSGKTTALKEWLERHPNARGVVSPDINGRRHFVYYPQKELIEMQTTSKEKETIEVGRFLFSKSGFEEVNQRLITDADRLESEWLVIDEIGSLELKGKGLFPALEYLLSQNHYKVIIVVRSKLLKQITDQFGLSMAKVIFKEELAAI